MVLNVERGSGIYLARSMDAIESFNKVELLGEDTRIKNQLEALFIGGDLLQSPFTLLTAEDVSHTDFINGSW